MEDGRSGEDTFKILIATDTHLGYKEKDPVRSNDSFQAFEEILGHARSNDVDLVLLAGDLFHDNKPSRETLHSCVRLFKTYCLGDRPVNIRFLSDPSINFPDCWSACVNYENPNLNISIPVFSIHGNHDDPAGLANLCALDLLSEMSLLNHFGKTRTLEDIEVAPLLMTKGKTKLAVYGLGSVKDERLHRLLLDQKVKFLRPLEHQAEWFNLLLFHQNRVKRGPTNYIPEQFLDDFLDLIIWGHEHDSIPEPQQNPQQKFYVIQPGSSVATSLSKAEALQKHCGLLEIYGKEFKWSKIPLRSVRQFYIEDICLKAEENKLDPEDYDIADQVKEFCDDKVKSLLAKAESEHSGDAQQPKLPLLRLCVDHSGGFEVFNVVRFGQEYANKVANPKDIILFHKKTRDIKENVYMDENAFQNALHSRDAMMRKDPVSLVNDYFENAELLAKLSILSSKSYGKAVDAFTKKDQTDALVQLVNYQRTKTEEYLMKQNVEITGDNLAEELERFNAEKRVNQIENKIDDDAEVDKLLLKATRDYPVSAVMQDDVDMELDAEDYIESDEDDRNTVTGSRGRGRGGRARAQSVSSRGRGRGGRARGQGNQQSIQQMFASSSQSGRGRGSRTACVNISDSDDDDMEISGRPASRNTVKRGASSRDVVRRGDNNTRNNSSSSKVSNQYTSTLPSPSITQRKVKKRTIFTYDSDDD